MNYELITVCIIISNLQFATNSQESKLLKESDPNFKKKDAGAFYKNYNLDSIFNDWGNTAKNV